MSSSKRLHAEFNEDPSDAPHPTKKAKAPRGKVRAAPIRRAVTKRSCAGKPVAAARAAPPVAGSTNLARAAVDLNEPDAGDNSDDDKDPACHGTEATKRTKRDGRTKAQVVAVTRTDLLKVSCSCPVEGCETMFDSLTHDANRHHLKRHYAKGALDVKASLPCLWTDCEARNAGTRMITHVHEHHMGRAGSSSVPFPIASGNGRRVVAGICQHTWRGSTRIRGHRE